MDCKLAGTDLSQSTLRDAYFERCSLSYTNLRMSTLERVAFDACRFEETDLYGVGDLGGCLLTDVQAHQLATHLALAAGASLEREN